MTPAPIRIWRDPTRRDVEELISSRGGELLVRHQGESRKFLCAFPSVGQYEGKCIQLGTVPTGVRPDWRSMLQTLGSDWA